MKLFPTILFHLSLFLFTFSLSAAPRFVTPGMIQRNGLTDEQYQLLWAQGKRPQIDIATARDWIFRSSRYQNVTDWLEVIGKTNDFARLVIPTMATNEVLTATNRVLSAAVGKLRQDLDKAIERGNELEHDADIYKALQKAAKRTEKNISKIVKTLEQAKKKASTEDEAALYTMLIELIQGNEPNA